MKFLQRGAAAAALSLSLAMPAGAHHNDSGDLRTYNSGTDHSRELRSIQKDFNRAVRDRRIILIDRDWLEINLGAAGAEPADNDLRGRYLAEHLLRQGRLHMPHEIFADMDQNIIDMPHSRTLSAAGGGSDPLRVCLVFGGQENLDGAAAVRDFLSVSRALHGDLIADAAVRNPADPGVYSKFVTYHEIGHCMDDSYIATMDAATDSAEFLALYHRAETFADTFSALMLAREEGITDIAGRIANLRLANMALSGPYQRAWSDPSSIGNYAGYIYATYRAVRGAQDYIDANGARVLRSMDISEVAALAQRITASSALSQPEAEALLYLFDAKFDTQIWGNLLGQVDFIDERYPHAVALKAEMEQALRAVFDLSSVPAGQNVLDLIAFDGHPMMAVLENLAGHDGAAQARRAQSLADDLLARAGSRPTMQRLMAVYSDRKDEWRAALAASDPARRREAMDNLAAAGAALFIAAERLREGPANDNRASPPVPLRALPRP